MKSALKTIGKKALYFIGFALVIVLLVVAGNFLYGIIFNPDSTATAYDDSSSSSLSDCNTLGINLHGTLVTYIPSQGSADDPDDYQAEYGDAVASENVVSSIQQANDDDSIKAIMLEVDSGGGSPVGGEEIAKALKASTKPTVAVIRQSGMSAAYWAATGAQQIFASRNSDVGSIGVTASYLENINKDEKYIQLTSGKYKDTGNPDKPITDDEKALLMRDVKIIYQNFMADVANNRNVPLDQIQAIADGSSVLGDKAMELHLIDQIGGWPEAEKYIQQKIGEKPTYCWQ